MDRQPQFFAILGKLHRLSDRDPLFDIPQDLVITAFKTDHHMAQTCLTQCFQRFIIGIGTGIDSPGDTERLDQSGNFTGMFPVGGKGVVVERELTHFGDIVHDP